jgi:hypothetical protein
VLVYGVLQVLYVQQNAVHDLLAALTIGIDHRDYPRLARIRGIRAESIGHPTRASARGGKASYHFITRVTLNKNGFRLQSNRPDGSMAWESVDIPDLIAQQRTDISDVLQKVIVALEREEEQHRQEHRGQTMEELLPPTLSYHFSKIAEATAGKPTDVGAALGLASVAMIRRALGEFREALVQRGLHFGRIHR